MVCNKRNFRKVAGLAAVCAMAVFVHASAFAEDLPSAEEVFAKYIEAIGGADAIGKVKNRHMKAKFAIPAMGMDATMEVYIEPPNMYSLVNIEAMGMKVETGVTDGVAWTINPMQGSSIQEGSEAAGTLRQADLSEYLHWKDHYEKAEVTGEEAVGDATCYKVEMTPKEGDASTLYFDKESGLLVQSVGMQQGMSVTASIGDYMEVDGVKYAGKISNSGGQMDIEITWESVEHNVDIPEGTFDLPDEIEAILNPPEPSPEASSDTSSDSTEESDK